MLLEVVRKAVGKLPVGVALDLHGNLTERMVAAATIASAYRTNPHEDALERGAEVAELTIAAARGEVRPTQATVKFRRSSTSSPGRPRANPSPSTPHWTA
jgi:microcystin degradation protein MlrC